MRSTAAWIVSGLLAGSVQALPADNQQRPLIFPIQDASSEVGIEAGQRKLHGRFLHITDMHPDPFFKIYSATDGDGKCHRGQGPAGFYGAETSSCDSPFKLINETLDWIEENLKDKVDFVVWTGDSARHDNDDKIPRNKHQLTYANNYIAGRMVDIFGRNDRGQTPGVIPTLGNNDILPHNIFYPAPNTWTKTYLNIWEPFIPEEQRHTFDLGGYFNVEVIPNKLAVFSLNTLYFFDSNAAVDGCYGHSQPGYRQFMWLKAQLQMMRQRGMKAILTGHVAPARTESKQNWDETCWQMYTLWTHQFRDVIVGSLYGHMDLDHFMLHDYDDVLLEVAETETGNFSRESIGDEISITGATDYFNELRDVWAQLPKVPKEVLNNKQQKMDDVDAARHKKSKALGGPWAERFSLSFVSPSIIPRYQPTLRVIEYNITGAHDKAVAPSWAFPARIRDEEQHDDGLEELKKRKKKKGKHGKTPNIKPPKGPSKSAPPGPAYSPQTFTWLGYTQYFANLTVLNNDFVDAAEVHGEKWSEGDFADKHPHKDKKHKAHPKKFGFEVGYDTREDKVYKLQDMTVKSYVDLARRIGKGGEEVSSLADVDAEKKHKKKKGGKKRKKMAKTWLTFMRRAFVGTVSDDDLTDKFGDVQSQSLEGQDGSYEL